MRLKNKIIEFSNFSNSFFSPILAINLSSYVCISRCSTFYMCLHLYLFIIWSTAEIREILYMLFIVIYSISN